MMAIPDIITVPTKFYDLYPLDDPVAVPFATNPQAPAYMPSIAYASFELQDFQGLLQAPEKYISISIADQVLTVIKKAGS